MNRIFSKSWSPHLLLGVAVLLVWGHTVAFDFVWDDTFFIRDLPSVRSVKNIPAMFTSIEAQATDPYLFRVFRPIRTAHYALLHALDGQEVPQPWIFHLANVLWHGATAMMLFAVLGALLPKLRPNLTSEEARGWALFVALAWAVHPAVSEVVCWAKSLDDILAAFFTLASLRELLQPAGKKAARWQALLWFALACYSKESAVPFVIVPFIIYRSIYQLDWRAAAQRTFLFGFVAAVYMAHRGWVIERQSQTAPLSGSYGQTLLDMLPVALKYFRLLWGVPPFVVDYKYLKGGYALTSPAVLAGALLLALLVALAVSAWRSRNSRTAGFGLLWTGLFLLPVSNLLPMMQYLAERFLYLPLMGWLLAVAALLALIPSRKIVLATAVLLVALWGWTARERSLIWRNELTLFLVSAAENPQAERLTHNAVAAVLARPAVARVFGFDEQTGKLSVRGAVDDAHRDDLLATLGAAWAALPENHLFAELDGIALALSGQPERAVVPLSKATELKPRNADYWLNLARAELDAGRPAAAVRAAQSADALAKDNAEVLAVLFGAQQAAGDLQGAQMTLLRWRKIQEANRKLVEE